MRKNLVIDVNIYYANQQLRSTSSNVNQFQ